MPVLIRETITPQGCASALAHAATKTAAKHHSVSQTTYSPDLLSVDPLNVVVNDHKAPEACSDLRLRAQGTGEGAGHHSTQQGLPETMQQQQNHTAGGMR